MTSNIIEFLKGKKTYIIVGIGVVALALGWAGIIPADLANKIAELCGLGSLITIRAAVKAAGKK
jgi:hypothetical protein